jgi:hypothetical protein
MGRAIGGITRTLFGGGTNQQQQTQSSQLDPRMFDMFSQNRDRATGVADNLQARQIAGFTPDFFTGRDQVLSTIGGSGQRSVQAAQDAARRATNFRAPTITGQGYNATTGTAQGFDATTGSAALGDRGDIRDVAAGSFLNANIGEYMNPFLNLVADNTMADMDRARQMTQMQNADAAARSGAFGGSRQGVLEAETNRGFFDRLGNTLGGLYASGFDTASGLALSDMDRALAAQLANQGVDQNVLGMNVGNEQAMNLANMAAQNEASRFGADAANTMSLANMAALNQASQFGATAQNAASLANQAAAMNANQQRLAATGLLGDLGNMGQQLALQSGEAATNLGFAQQQLNQSRLDAIRNLPLEQQEIINQALGLNVGGGSGAVSTGQSSGSGTSQDGIFSAMSPPSLRFSDIRMKENIVKVGELPNGLNLYEFEYKPEFIDNVLAGPGRQIGVMAQEVEKVMPEAVFTMSNGYKAVDYDQLGAHYA